MEYQCTGDYFSIACNARNPVTLCENLYSSYRDWVDATVADKKKFTFCIQNAPFRFCFCFVYVLIRDKLFATAWGKRFATR